MWHSSGENIQMGYMKCNTPASHPTWLFSLSSSLHRPGHCVLCSTLVRLDTSPEHRRERRTHTVPDKKRQNTPCHTSSTRISSTPRVSCFKPSSHPSVHHHHHLFFFSHSDSDHDTSLGIHSPRSPISLPNRITLFSCIPIIPPPGRRRQGSRRHAHLDLFFRLLNPSSNLTSPTTSHVSQSTLTIITIPLPPIPPARHGIHTRTVQPPPSRLF